MLSDTLKSFHDAVYVLTIESARERHENVVQQLGEGNFEFVYGIDKNTVTKTGLIEDGVYDEEMAQRVDPKDRVMTLGHVCCAFGHRSVYQKMLESDCQRALVFEDDVVDLGISDNIIESALSNLPNDWELIYWGWSGGRFKPMLGSLQQLVFHIRYKLGMYKLNHRMISNLYMRPFNDYFDVSSVNFLLHSYSITRSAAEKLIRWNTPIHYNSDHAAIHAVLDGDIRAYVSKKQFFGQRSFDPADPLESMTQKYY
jgi:glycosyl transferase family 25